MRWTTIILFLVLIGINACRKKDETPMAKGEITVSTEKKFSTIWESSGYSFENNAFVIIRQGNEDADIIPLDIANIQNEPIGIRLSTNSTNTAGFYLNTEFPDLNSANSFFNTYLSAVAGSFSPLTDTIRPYQIFTMKTNHGNWLKFMVMETRARKDATDKVLFYEADLKYVIQRDGSTEFPE